MEKSIKKVIWEQVFPEDAEIRIQQAFEMLLGDEFGLTDDVNLGVAIDRYHAFTERKEAFPALHREKRSRQGI
jgi:hypothetical protein